MGGGEQGGGGFAHPKIVSIISIDTKVPKIHHDVSDWISAAPETNESLPLEGIRASVLHRHVWHV